MQSRALRQAVQIDQYVDFVVANQARGRLIRYIPNMPRVIERRQHPRTDIAVVIDRRAIAKDFETRAIMLFEQFGNQETHGVAAEIG